MPSTNADEDGARPIPPRPQTAVPGARRPRRGSRAIGSSALQLHEEANRDLQRFLKEMQEEDAELDDNTSILQQIRRATPALSLKPRSPSSNSRHFVLKGDESDTDILNKTLSHDSDASSAHSHRDIQPMSDEEKLEAIVAEFGPVPENNEIRSKEEIVASETAVLVRRVVVRGYLVLTTHRLCFLALLNTNVPKQDTLQQGPAIIHRPGLTRKKRKAWMKLTSDSLMAYPNSSEMYEPLGGVKLVDIEDVQPNPLRNSIHFKVNGKSYSMEYETKEATLAWQREIDAAIWKLTHDFDKIRISIPLVRVAQMSMSDLLDSATLIRFDILDIESPAHKHPRLHRHERNPYSTVEVAFAMVRGSNKVVPELEPAVTLYNDVRLQIPCSDWWKLPNAVIDIDGPRTSADPSEDTDHTSMQKQYMIIREFTLECKPEEVHCKYQQISSAHRR